MVQAAVGGGLPRPYLPTRLALACLALVFSLGCAGRGGGLDDPDAAMDTGIGSGDVSTVPFMCRNGNKDIGETDVNCGGPCPPCALNQGCAQDVDCAKGKCVLETAKCTAPATCSNGRKDANETDLDCGGPDCTPCAANKSCRAGDDCVSGMCVSDRCGA